MEMNKLISTVLPLILAVLLLLPAVQPVSASAPPASWSSGTISGAYRIYGIWGVPPPGTPNLYAVGQTANGSNHGGIFNYDGSAWTSIDISVINPSKYNYYGVWGTGYNDVWAVGQGGIISHRGETMWSNVPWSMAVSPLNAVWGVDHSNVYAVGNGIIHYDGTTWSVVTTGLTDSPIFKAIWGSSANDIFAVGSVGSYPTSSGVIAHWNGTAWSYMTVPAIAGLNAVWGSASNDVYAVINTAAPNFLHWDGSSWTNISSSVYGGTDGFDAIWGNSSSNIYAAGSGIAHFDGTNWSRVYPPSGYTGGELAMGSTGSIIVVGGYTSSVIYFSPSTDATLSSLGVSSGTLVPVFGSANTS